tara:strand:- start:415 stop:1947 length:1533 start_codon:yes stop_codon:yes gene_type:complete
MMIRTSLAYYIWIKSLKKYDHEFKISLNDPILSQWKILRKYLKNNSKTQYGKKYNFSNINSIERFQKLVPIINYSDIEHLITHICNGKQKIISSDKTLFFEETTGLEKISKLIPYNKTLKQEFLSAIGPWITSLSNDYPNIFEGKSYWSISPPMKQKRHTISGLEIGLNNDSGYLNRIGKILSNYLLLMIDSNVSSEQFYLNTLKIMLKEKKMGFISVYSPSFLIQLNNLLRKNWAKVIPESLKLNENAVWSDIFKNVKVISCWLDSSSAQFKNEIESFIGEIKIQPKGLLSTEGIVSIPYKKNYDPVLAITSHFFEFESQKDGLIYLADDLKQYEQYEVIMSTGNGIMRYRTDDIIEATNFIGKTPTIKFIGRKNKFSDIVGEKVSEISCINTLKLLESKFQLRNYAAFFYVSDNNNIYNYNLVIHSDKKQINIEKINKFVEKEFNKNAYYLQAINMKQLNRLKSILINKSEYNKLMDRYFKNQRIKEGDRKPPILFNLNASLILSLQS